MIKTMVDTLTNIFYGDNWFIAWALIALPLLIAAVSSIVGIIKSKKEEGQQKKDNFKLFKMK